ncbi:MAG: NosD domain-containing protein [Promethearchaeota archaeon]
MLKTRIRMKVLAEFSFLLITFLIIPIIPLLKIHQREPAFGIEKLENLKKSGYWLNCPRIHINNDNWSATPLPWIQNRTGIWSDPHIIENVTIDAGGSGSGILIENSNDFFIIKNCTVYNSGNGLEDAGIKLISVSNGILINNNFSSNNKYGMYLFDSDVNTVIGNTVNNNNEWGVYLWQSNNNTVSGNIANNNTYRGINLYLCDNNMISGNYVHNSTDYGIYIDTSNNNTISGNIVNNNIEYGMYIITSDNNIILENNAHKNSYVGIQLEGSFYNKILGNNVQNNSWSGICLYLSQENTVSGNIASNNGVDGGILLYEFGSYNTISGNIFKNNDYGIHLAAFCDNNTITENIILNNSITGLEITSSSCNNNSIYNNVFLNNTLHAKDDGSDNHWNTSLIGNYWDNYTGLDNAPFDGIGDIPYNISRTPLIRDFLPIFQNPIHNGSKIHINESGVNSLNWSQTALVKWWCMGSGTYSNPYLIEDLIIDAKNLGSGIFIENSNDYFIIRNCTVYNAGSVWYEAGIRLQSVSNGTIFENKVSNNNYDGIYLIDSSNNTISENTVKYNDYGIAM